MEKSEDLLVCVQLVLVVLDGALHPRLRGVHRIRLQRKLEAGLERTAFHAPLSDSDAATTPLHIQS